MTPEEAIRIINHEIQCVVTSNDCDHDCGKCLLALKEEAILEAYHLAIDALRRMNSGNS